LVEAERLTEKATFKIPNTPEARFAPTLRMTYVTAVSGPDSDSFKNVRHPLSLPLVLYPESSVPDLKGGG
jgi:hypothetical protein